jgi:hypothetical protein
MAVDTLNTLDAQAIGAGLDLGGVTDPTDALGAFDLQELENNQTDPGDPSAKKKPVTMADLKKGYNIQMQSLKQMGEIGVVQMADQSRNQFQAARVAEFDAKKLNVDRYLGYGKETFNKVGFSPFVDNEKNFNKNTTIWQDYGRMASVFGSLAYEGGVSGYRSMASLAKGDDFFSPDDQTAENFAKLQSIGMSNKGGIGGWVNNFALNSAYTVGIGLSILAEEAALFGATVVSEGAMGGIAAMRTSANAVRFGKALKQAYNTNAIGNIWSGGVGLAKSLSKIQDAKTFYTAAKAGAYTLGKGALQFVNPLTRTTDDVVDMARGTASIRNASNAAKAKQTFGSFYRDMRDLNLALSESKLEGGSARLDKINELMDKYEKDNGKAPEGKDLERIYEQAEDTGYGVTAINFPTIYLTNRVVLDGLFKFRGFKTLDEAAEMAQKGVGFKKGTGYFDALADGWVKSTKNNLMNPKAYVGMGLSYFRRNFAEGIQENLQNVTSDAVSAYYDGVYKDPTLGGFDYGAGHAWNAITEEATSMRGLDTFASGFLMGGFMGKAQNLFLKDVPSIYYRVAQPTKYAEFKANKLQTRQQAINGLNELYKNPLKYFSSANESAVVQKHTSDVMNQAEAAGDAKTFQDAKDLKMFDHIFTALDNGTFEGLIDNYKELSKLDSKELANFLGTPESGKNTEKLQEIISRAEEIKHRYDTISKQFKNPFTPNKIKKGTPEFTREAIAFRAFESAKKTAIASQYNFDRSLQRMNGLYNDLATNRPVSKASSSDFTILTDLNILDNEISLLDKEVKSYQGVTDAEQKKLGEQKKDRLDRLMDYRDKLRTHLEKANNTEVEENGQIRIQFGEDTIDPLKESYKAYLKQIAAVNSDYVFDDKIDDSFVKLLDYYNLNSNARNYNQIVNNLLDPGNLFKHAERLNAKLTDLFQNRETDTTTRVERAQRVMEMSELLKAITAQGVMLDPEELQEFVRTGKKPTTFIDAGTLKDLDPSSPKYAAVQAILNIDDQIRDDAPSVTADPVVEKPATTEDSKPADTTTTPAAEVLDPELQLKLEDAYNQYIEETGSEMSFDEFVRISARAARIKAQFNKGKAQPAAAPAPQTSTPAPSAPVVSDIEETGKQLQAIHMMVNRIESLSTEERTLMNKYYDLMKAESLRNGGELSERYYKVKNDGSNPELVKQVEEFLSEAKRLKLTPVSPPSTAPVSVEDKKADIESEQTTPANTSAEIQTPAEKTGTQKAQELIDSVSSIRDLPDLSKADSKPITIDLIELISTGQAKSKDITAMLAKRRGELLKNISPKDLQKGDIVTFVDGRKGFVKSVNDNEVSVKIAGSSQAAAEIIDAKDLSKKISNIEPGKAVSMEPTPDIEITPQDKKEVEASQDAKSAFTENSSAVKQVGENAAKAAGTDNQQNLNNLLQNLGCKTK